MRSERGAGAALALAIIGIAVVLAAAVLAVAGVVVGAARIDAAADAAALAAADTAAGFATGDPCDRAAAVVSANDATLTGCALDGLVARVEATASIAGFAVTAVARAGPPSERP